MTKAEMNAAASKAVEMATWGTREWAAFNRQYAAQETITGLHAIDREAYKAYMVNAGLAMTEPAGGHYATVTHKRGAAYVDYKAMMVKLAAMGIDVDALETEFAKRRPDTDAFSFK